MNTELLMIAKYSLPFVIGALLKSFFFDKQEQTLQSYAKDKRFVSDRNYITPKNIWHGIQTLEFLYIGVILFLVSPVFAYSGVIAWVLWTFYMGWKQSNKEDWKHYGDGYNALDEVTYRKASEILGVKYKNVAFIGRIVILLICLIFILYV